MPQNSLNRSILKLAIPNIISNITVPLLGFVDMMLMGHQDSLVYIGAIGLGGTIFSVMYSIFSFMRAGTTGFTAQAYGANDRAEIAYSLYRALCIALIATVLVLSLQNAVEWLSMKLLNGSEEVVAYTATYFHVRIWAAPAVLCLYAFNGWYIGMQNTTIPMIIAILTNVVNIVLSIIFVNCMGMGVSGVALGTVIAQYCGLITWLAILITAIIFLFAKFRHHLIPIRRVILLQADKLKRFFKVNADFMIRSILLVLSIAYFNNQSAKLGDDMLAVNMILMQFFYIFSYFTDGFAYAGEALVGRFTGAHDAKQLRQTVKLLFIWGFLIALPFTVLYALFPNWFIGLVSDQPDIIPMAKPYHIYLAAIPLITFAAFLWDGIYIGATAARAIRNTMLISAIGVFLPSTLLLMPHFGNHGLWIAFLLFMIARGLSMTLMARKAVLSLK